MRPLINADKRITPACRARWLACAAWMTFAVPHGAAYAVETPLSLSDAQQRAAEISNGLVAQEATVTALRAMTASAGELPDPVIKLGVDNLPVDGADPFSLTRDFMTMRRVGISQEYTRHEKRRLRRARGEHDIGRALAEKSAALIALKRDTALAWLERYYAEATAQAIAGQIDEARLVIGVAEDAYKAGRGQQADVIAARRGLMELENRASAARLRLRAARFALARWVGDDVEEAPLAQRPDIDTLPPELDAVDDHLPFHPELTVLSQQAHVAETEAKLARAERKPDWSWELMYSRRGAAFSNMISLGVSVPLQWNQKNRQDRDLAAKLALAEQARAQREDLLRMHSAEVRTIIEEWKGSRERHRRYQSGLVPLAQDLIETTMAAYRGGKAGLADVLSARRDALEARLQALQTEAEMARAWAQLSFLFLQEEGGSPASAQPLLNASEVRP